MSTNTQQLTAHDRLTPMAARRTAFTGTLCRLLGTLSLLGVIGCGAAGDLAEAEALAEQDQPESQAALTPSSTAAQIPEVRDALAHKETEKTSWKRCNRRDPNVQCFAESGYYSWVELTNRTSLSVYFRIDEWHSSCGWPGSIKNTTYWTIPPNGTIEESFISAGGCREKWLVNCRLAGDISVNCADVISSWSGSEIP